MSSEPPSHISDAEKDTVTPIPVSSAGTPTNTSTSVGSTHIHTSKSKLAAILGAIALSLIALLGINNYRQV